MDKESILNMTVLKFFFLLWVAAVVFGFGCALGVRWYWMLTDILRLVIQ